MSELCVRCSDNNRTNQHKLKPFLLSINYESVDVITSLELPRRYTSAYNDISIGNNYNHKILQHEDVIKRQSHIMGEWLRKDDKLEIYLTVIISSKQNPDAENRNKIFCDKLGLILESIAFAETSLLKSHPFLDSTKIFVKFQSLDPKYDRTEYCHRLGYWVPDCMRDLSEIPSSKLTFNAIPEQKSLQKDLDINDKKKNQRIKQKHRETSSRYNTSNFIS